MRAEAVARCAGLGELLQRVSRAALGSSFGLVRGLFVAWARVGDLDDVWRTRAAEFFIGFDTKLSGEDLDFGRA